jgi:hypothetical protein
MSHAALSDHPGPPPARRQRASVGLSASPACTVPPPCWLHCLVVWPRAAGCGLRQANAAGQCRSFASHGPRGSHIALLRSTRRLSESQNSPIAQTLADSHQFLAASRRSNRPKMILRRRWAAQPPAARSRQERPAPRPARGPRASPSCSCSCSSGAPPASGGALGRRQVNWSLLLLPSWSMLWPGAARAAELDGDSEDFFSQWPYAGARAAAQAAVAGSPAAAASSGAPLGPSLACVACRSAGRPLQGPFRLS